MPYIKDKDRVKFQGPAIEIANLAECAGDLNYAITIIMHSYLKKKSLNYANLNELIGMMECCKLELYRKVASPYEDIKATENGDIGLLANQNSIPL